MGRLQPMPPPTASTGEPRIEHVDEAVCFQASLYTVAGRRPIIRVNRSIVGTVRGDAAVNWARNRIALGQMGYSEITVTPTT